MDTPSKFILLADDDLDDQELLKEAFRQAAPLVEVEAVSFGKDVLNYLHKCPDNNLPCLIVLDYNMPDMNGAQVLSQLCLHERFRHIPAVIWSTSNAYLYKEVCKKNGAREYFQKPHQFEEMIRLCRQMYQLAS